MKRHYSHTLALRLTPAQAHKLQVAAFAHGLSVSDMVRAMLRSIFEAPDRELLLQGDVGSIVDKKNLEAYSSTA